jgi:hypothetical protein
MQSSVVQVGLNLPSSVNNNAIAAGAARAAVGVSVLTAAAHTANDLSVSDDFNM